MHAKLDDGLQELLTRQGAAFVAFADLSELPVEARQGYPRGVSIGAALDPAIVAQITTGPTQAYEAEYNRLNRRLGELAQSGADYLRQRGFDALAAVATINQRDELYARSFTTRLPHKTVATRAGAGWIGKCALLVTKPFGSAVRLTTILTHAPLPIAPAINASQCGECRVCVDVCPTNAPSGKIWQAGLPREAFFDAFACCRTTERWQAERNLEHRICGMCMAACPWTQRYLKGKQSA